MRQVPQKILIVGSGRMALHLAHYFDLIGCEFQTWSRQKNSIADFENKVLESNRILLAISDSALQEVTNHILKIRSKKPIDHGSDLKQVHSSWDLSIIHFSGATAVANTIAVHPLMTFGADLYDLDIYKKIHFTVFDPEKKLADLLPGLQNPWTSARPEQQGLYHALCVLGGNFPVLLWNKMDHGLQKLGLPPEASQIYLEQVFKNFMNAQEKSLTGPLVRKDVSTIEKNLAALGEDPFAEVYRSFVKAYSTKKAATETENQTRS